MTKITNQMIYDTIKELKSDVKDLYKKTNHTSNKVTKIEEHMRNQNDKLERNSNEIKGIEGTVTEHDGEIKDMFNTMSNIENIQTECRKKERNKALRLHEWSLKKFGVIVFGGLTTIQILISIAFRLL